MLIDIENSEYKNIVTDEDFLEVISEKISPEFSKEIGEKISEQNNAYQELQFGYECYYEHSEEVAQQFQRIYTIMLNIFTMKLIEECDTDSEKYDKLIKYLHEVEDIANEYRQEF